MPRHTTVKRPNTYLCRRHQEQYWWCRHLTANPYLDAERASAGRHDKHSIGVDHAFNLGSHVLQDAPHGHYTRSRRSESSFEVVHTPWESIPRSMLIFWERTQPLVLYSSHPCTALDTTPNHGLHQERIQIETPCCCCHLLNNKLTSVLPGLVQKPENARKEQGRTRIDWVDIYVSMPPIANEHRYSV